MENPAYRAEFFISKLRSFNMKRITVFVTLFTAFALSVHAQDAVAQSAISIMERANRQNDAATMSSRSRMVITARDGTTSERVMDQYSKDDTNGNNRAVIVFQNPATVRGTRFLMMDNASGDTDQWIFLPGLGKVRRIAASESGGSFMGTDFSYDDMSMMSRDVGEDTHTILREETIIVDGISANCYVIQSVPKDSSFQYSKMISWVDKDKYRIYKRELYNRRGTVEKVMEVSGFKDVQGRDTGTQTKVSTMSAGTSTTLYMDIIKYDDPIPEGVFTTAYLETGRVR
jgi:outer membrane lipoprotein-sorting protein